MPWENSRPKHVPTKVRDACLTRDGHQCTQTQRDGTRCRETTSLEAAHLEQWVAGETTTLADVRTLCHWHHNQETQREARAARAKTKKPPTHLHPTDTHPAFKR